MLPRLSKKKKKKESLENPIIDVISSTTTTTSSSLPALTAISKKKKASPELKTCLHHIKEANFFALFYFPLNYRACKANSGVCTSADVGEKNINLLVHTFYEYGTQHTEATKIKFEFNDLGLMGSLCFCLPVSSYVSVHLSCFRKKENGEKLSFFRFFL